MVYQLANKTRARRRKLQLQRRLVPNLQVFLNTQTVCAQMVSHFNSMIEYSLCKDAAERVQIVEVARLAANNTRKLSRATWFHIVRQTMKLRSMYTNVDHTRELMSYHRRLTKIYLIVDKDLVQFLDIAQLAIDLFKSERMFNVRVDIEPFVSGASAAAREEYVAYYICVYEVNPECKNDRSLIVMSKYLLPGMTNPVGLNSGNSLRQTLTLSTHANLSYPNKALGLESCENVVPGAGNNSKLQVAHNKCSIAKLSNLPDSHWAACGWRISLMAQCYHDVVTSEDVADQHAPRAVQDGDRTLRKMREQKLGEVFLANSEVGLCLTQATRENPTVQIRLPIVSNDSHVLDAFNAQNRFVDIYVRPLVLRTPENLLFEREIQKWQAAQEFRQTTQQDYVQQYYAQYHKLMDIYTRKCFPKFGETQNLSPRQLQVASETKYLPRGICAPLQPGMTRFHVPEWLTYPIDETFGNTTALPIWMYSLPRSNFGANLSASDPRFLNACAFLKRLLIASANSYNTSPSELFEIFQKFSTVQTQKPIEKDKATLLTVREVVAHFLTLASFMGKYRSDFAISPTGKIQPTESCDLNRISGESISDDCEGCEGVTREVFLMLLDFAPRLKDSTNVVDLALCAMARFLDLHYEYLSASGSTTAAFPGCNIHGEAQGLSQTEAFFESRSNLPGNRHTLRKMMYGSQEDQNAEVGFHQYSILMPTRHMVELMQNENGLLDNPKFATNTELLNSVKSYYGTRASESERVLGKDLTPMLQPIVLESTWPVSTFLVGPSAYLASPPGPHTKNDTNTYNVFENEHWSEYAKKILKCDELAAAEASKLRKVTSAFSGVPARCKDLHNLRILGGHFHPQDPTKAYRFKEDSERYTTLFYRHPCHFVNVSLLRNLQDKFSVAVRGAMSYSTLCHGSELRYGAPLDHLQLMGLPENHPFANKTPHFIFHPFLRTTLDHLETLGKLQEKSQFEAHLPPVLIGTATDMKEEDYSIQSSDFAQTQVDSFAERVLNSRIVMIEGMSGPDYKDTENRVWQTMSSSALGGDVPSPTIQRFKLFDVFGDFVSFISTTHTPK